MKQSNLYTKFSKELDGFRLLINLKKLNSCVECKYFKMDGLFFLDKLLEKDDFLCKLNLKYAYFSANLHKDSQKYVRFK